MSTATSAATVRRLVSSASAALLLVALVVGSAAASAAAHDRLVTSTPADGATTDVPTAVQLQFDAAVAEDFSTVVVTGPDGQMRSTGEAAVSGTDVRQAVSAGPAGTWTADYRVVSSDGHPITGRIAFTVTTADQAARPAPAPQPDPTAAPGPAEDAGAGEGAPRTAGENALLFLIVAVVLVPFALLASFAVRRVRQAEQR